MELNEKIKTLRKARNWSQVELADKLGVHRNHMNRLEAGQYTPSIDLLKKMSAVFGVSTDFLLNEEMEIDEPLNLKNKTLFEKIKIIDDMEEFDQSTILNVIDAFIIKKQLWSVMNKTSVTS